MLTTAASRAHLTDYRKEFAMKLLELICRALHLVFAHDYYWLW
jgi:hypothetical protein